MKNKFRKPLSHFFEYLNFIGLLFFSFAEDTIIPRCVRAETKCVGCLSMKHLVDGRGRGLDMAYDSDIRAQWSADQLTRLVGVNTSVSGDE